MAYADQPTMSPRKLVSIVAVILLHVVIGYAFVTGLAFNVVKKVAKDLNVVDIAEEAPPPEDLPPPPPPETKVEPPPVVAPPPIVQVAPTIAPPIVSVPVAPPVVITPTAPVAPPKPQAPAVALKARGTPGEWVTPEDYPSGDMRAGNQGTTGFRLEVDAGGKVTNCTVTSSSGFPSLDTKACQMLMRRARFSPAKNTEGQGVPASYSNRVRWQIPND
ncbi:energy transducer TonB [Sphingomonas montanisoli]|uniref:Energy transducer TonB n=1 Tax=Sphingomonas montanisoli TaxID=2606412 RepID=A0A5D9C899_9SPHN|nr:energy transducer TonB [Sphingomonas montanisoli]TZG28128.1 energy transducer TonB [Sphingomonas montanisoli]